MFANYLKISIRNLRRNKFYSIINIGGMAVGILCCLLLTLYVRYEWSFDGFHPSADRIYRITEFQSFPGKDRQHVACTAGLMAHTLKLDYPEVFAASRLGSWGTYPVKVDGKMQFFQDATYADSNFFGFFRFRLVSGDPATALVKPFSVVLARSTAQRLFGTEDAAGKTLTGTYGEQLTITGVAENPPENSHIRYDALISWSSTTAQSTAQKFSWMNNWRTQGIFSYVLLAPGIDKASLEQKFPEFLKRHMPERVGYFDLSLQPLLRIHLSSSDLLYDFNVRKGDGTTVAILAWIALFILLIACVNFMNLATARSMQRAREIGLRKTVGAYRWQIVAQLLSESWLIALLSTFLAIALAEVVLPSFETLVGRNLSLNFQSDPLLLAAVAGVALVSGIFAGSYPAFYLSAFRPIDVMKGFIAGGTRGATLRRTLVVAQFSIAIVLIVGTLVIRNQLDFVRSKGLGFDREQLMWMGRPGSPDQLQTVRSQLMQNSAVLDVTGSSRVPGRNFPTYAAYPETGGADEHWDLPIISVDDAFLRTYGIGLREGRGFSAEMPADQEHSVIINETMMKRLGWKSVAGHRIRLKSATSAPMDVIGVVSDFHIKSMHEAVEPLIMQYDPTQANFLTLRVRPGQSPEATRWAETVWKHVAPDEPFRFSFLDDDFNSLYRADERTGEVIGIFSVLAIFVAALGLSGLASYTAERRTREIGVRKVLGAGVPSIIRLLTREFVVLVLVANVVAWPVAYFVMIRWLGDFAYRVNLGILTFLVPGVVALFIALATVSFHAIRAALSNPVEALRYE